MTTNFRRSGPIVIATNNGDVGGGEVMLLNLAESLAEMAIEVTVVGPSSPSTLVDAARARGLNTVVLEAKTRLDYLLALRRWDRSHRTGLLWCNGLLPAVATIARKMRVVHLHQRPVGKFRILAGLARWRALTTVVPSANMAAVIRGSRVLNNWVKPVGLVPKEDAAGTAGCAFRVGFLGRPSTDKGVEVLCEAVTQLRRDMGTDVRLVVAGESRFVDAQSSSEVDKALHGLGNAVERVGWITPAEFFGRVDVLVCPSVWPEPFGLVVIEAFSAKVPVVVSDAGALPEVVGLDHPWIARKGDAKDLSKLILSALHADEPTLQRAYERWERKYSPAVGSQNLKSLLIAIGYVSSPEES